MQNKEVSLSLFETLEPEEALVSPFSNRKVVVEGVFQSYSKEVLKTKIKRLGGSSHV